MPFNPSGLFQRLFDWTDDRDAGVKILADRMDQETDGMVDGINQMILEEVEWKGPHTGVNGTAEAPAYSFTDDPDTGVHRSAENELSVVAGGQTIASFNDSKTLSTRNVEVENDAPSISISETDTATAARLLLADGVATMEVPTGTVFALKGAGTGDISALQVKVGGSFQTVWHTGNMGSGSGLNADQLDGQEGSFFQDADNLNAGTVPTARLAGTYSISITGNAATATNASQLGGQAPTYYNNANNLAYGTVPTARLSGSYSISITGNAATATNADKLDGQEGAFFQDADNLNAGTVPTARLAGTYSISITGNAATATNADKLDGWDSAQYRNASNLNAGTVPTGRLSGSYSISITGNAYNSFNLGGVAAANFQRSTRLGTESSKNLDAQSTWFRASAGQVMTGIYTGDGSGGSWRIGRISYRPIQRQELDGSWVTVSQL